ncbi:MAG: chemotaxis protein CheA [Polyangiaceae bacterium]
MSSVPTLEAIKLELSSLSPSDSQSIARALSALAAAREECRGPAQRFLSEASQLLTSVSTGTASDPQAALAAASRFVAAAAGLQPSAPAVEEPPAEVARVKAVCSFDDADRELVSEFIAEASDYISRAESALLVLESQPDDLTSVDNVFRAFHTIKGVAAMLGLEIISQFAHHAESLFSRIRARSLRFEGTIPNLALGAVDAIKSLLVCVQSVLEGRETQVPAELEALTAALVSASTQEADETLSTPSEEERPAPKSEEEPSKSLDWDEDEPSATSNEAASPVYVQAESRVSNESSAHEPQRVEPRLPEDSLQSAVHQAVAPNKTNEEAFVRLRTERLDRLVDMVGELVIAQAMVRQDPTLGTGEQHDLLRKVTHAGKIVRELQELAMSLRMVPFKPTFQKLARVVRDTAQKSGKEVELVLHGEDTEIDRNMVDAIADPLVHMLRNAVDHGIEAPEERQRVGKSRTGKVTLSASHAGGNIIVELRDDGVGLDRARIVKKAIEKGLIDSDNGMADSDVFALIFEPGFSTKEQVSDLSGRGVGMDVVRRNIQGLNGQVEIISTLGQGSTFVLRLPLTLAITDGMLVRVGTERYILPTVAIQTSLRPNSDNLNCVAGRGEILLIRGELIPMFRLHRIFDCPGAVEDPTRGLVVVVNGPEGRSALLVDELLGQQQVVTKSLGTALGTIRGVAGGAILGDGRVGLILDTPSLIALAREDNQSVAGDQLIN